MTCAKHSSRAARRQRLSGMKKRFEEYLDEKAKGMDPAKVRIVIE